MSDPDRRVFPIVYSFEGHPSEDGSAFLVEAKCFDDSVTRFAIPVDNIQHLIAFLLVWVGKISAADPGDAQSCGDGGERLPIPATSIAIGEPSGDEAYIGISVGRAELVFSLPVSSLGSVGQSLLAGTPVNSTIRAPVKGATRRSHRDDRSQRVSIRTPVKGATRAAEPNAPRSEFRSAPGGVTLVLLDRQGRFEARVEGPITAGPLSRCRTPARHHSY